MMRIKVVAALMLGALALLLFGCGTNPVEPVVPTNTGVGAQPAPTSTTQGQAQATPSATPWVPPTALAGTRIPGAEATLTAAPVLQTGILTITNKKGEKVNMTVEIADTNESRELGLMHRASMDPDAGMLFSWTEDVEGGFWMYNTILPLSIAYISADGTILNIEDMQPLDQNTTRAAGPYRYALEANQGYFRAHEITAGDKVTLPSQQTSFIPSGMPGCCCPESASAP